MGRNKIRSVSLLLLLKEGKICLGKRQNTGMMDGLWALPGGHVEKGETPLSGIIREAKEEIGITFRLESLEFVGVLYLHTKECRDEFVNFIFLAEKWQGEVINREPYKCQEWKFFNLDSLPSSIVPSQKNLIENWKLGKVYSEFGF